MKNFKFCFATSPAKHTDYTVSRLRGYKFASTDKAKGETVIVFYSSPVLHISVTGIIRSGTEAQRDH